MKRFLMFALTAVSLVTPLAAQIQIPLDSLAAKAVDVKGISLDQSMIKLAADFLAGNKAKDSGFQKVLEAVKSITVKRYSFAQEGAYQPAELEPLRAVLRVGGWNQMFTRNRSDKQSSVYLKMDGLQIGGVTVVSAEPRQVVVVSVEGAIDLAKLAQLAGHLGIPPDIAGGGSNTDQPADSRIDPKPVN